MLESNIKMCPFNTIVAGISNSNCHCTRGYCQLWNQALNSCSFQAIEKALFIVAATIKGCRIEEDK